MGPSCPRVALDAATALASAQAASGDREAARGIRKDATAGNATASAVVGLLVPLVAGMLKKKA